MDFQKRLEELKKQVESLKRKTSYLLIILITVTISMIGLSFRQVQQYSRIQDYYIESMESNQRLNQILTNWNQNLEDLLAKLK